MSIQLGHFKWVQNKDREFGSSNGWFAGYIVIQGVTQPAMLTVSDITTITERAADNREDMPGLEAPAKRDSPFITMLKKMGL